MTTTPVQDVEPFAGHSPTQKRPLGGYAALMGPFSVAAGGFATWMRCSGRVRAIPYPVASARARSDRCSTPSRSISSAAPTSSSRPRSASSETRI